MQALELTCGNRIAGLGSQLRIVVARPQQSGQIVLLGEPLVQTLLVCPLAELFCFEQLVGDFCLWTDRVIVFNLQLFDIGDH